MPIVINGSGSVTGITTRLAAAAAPAGSVIQCLQDVKSDTFSTTSDTPVDVTGWSQAITMTAASNKVLVQVSCGMVSMESAGNAPEIFLVRGSTLIALGDANGNRTRVSAAVGDAHTYGVSGATITFLDTPGAGTHTYKVQMATQGGSGTAVLNKRGDDDNSASYQVSTSTLTVMEIAA